MNLDASTVTAILKRTPFNPKRLRTWGVRVDGLVWPVKDAYAVITKQTSMKPFHTEDALRAFRKLGMKVLHVSRVTK